LLSLIFVPSEYLVEARVKCLCVRISASHLL
jgi:hypothetical protein